MNSVFEIAASGLSAQQRALDVTANNVTNINTTAFKRADVRYEDVAVQAALARQGGGVAVAVGGVAVRAQDELDVQGEIEVSGRALDLALDGPGFVELMGPGGRTLLWRGGQLEVTRDGFLGAANGLPLMAMIAVPPDATDIDIARDGTVSARIVGTGDVVVLGTIEIAMPDAMASLERMGGGLYRMSETADVRRAGAGEDGAATLVQGALERSNVNLNAEMIQMLIIQRAYAANAQLVQAADQMMGIANNLRRS